MLRLALIGAAAAGGLAAPANVLLTGFAAFDHKSDNPSADVAKALNGTCKAGVCFKSLVLPVTSAGASVVASMLAKANSSEWDAVLMLGEDVPAMFQSVKLAHLELVAANVRSHSRRQLGAGRAGDDQLISGAPTSPTTY